MDTKKIIALGLIFGGGMWLATSVFSRPSRPMNYNPNYNPGFQDVPRPPQESNVQKWKNWASSVVNLYGDVKELWQPGGPFSSQSYSGQDVTVVDELLPSDFDNIA